MNNYSKDVSIFYGFNSGSNDITEKNAFANFVEQVGTLIQKEMISKDEANQVFLAMLLTHGDNEATFPKDLFTVADHSKQIVVGVCLRYRKFNCLG